ncbi:MAG: AAA family ATPase [Pseudomonadales bacterium]
MHDLNLLLKSAIPIISLLSRDEKHALQMLTRIAVQQKLPIHVWSASEGLQALGFGATPNSSSDTLEPEAALRYIKQNGQSGLYVLCDFHPYLQQAPLLTRLLKDIALEHETTQRTLVMLSHALQMPAELTHFNAELAVSFPSQQEIMALVREEANRWSEQNAGQRVKTDQQTLQQLISHIRGMSMAETRRLVRGAIVNDGAITESDLPLVNKARFTLMDLNGVLSYEYDTEQWSSVAGMQHLQEWLRLREKAFLDANTLDKPKGLLLTGVQGGGKSLAAKAVAGLWQLPLLRLDIASLYNKFIGETERNLRDALKLAESMAPCVLWIDELEKAISSGASDEGTSRRLLGTLLTWLAEKKEAVFIVATSNSIQQLPPELLRKGRFDEVFFVDLPDTPTRAQIFRIHLHKREQCSTTIDCAKLAEYADGFSGAEIEQAVIAALYQCAAASQPLTTEHIVSALGQTVPLSVLMAENLAALRAWAAERAVPAH